MPRPLILFDIDKTIIDTDKLRELILQSLAEVTHTAEEEIMNSFLEYTSDKEEMSGFHPQEFLTLLSEKFHTPLKNLETVFFDPKRFQLSLHPEALEVLTRLKKEGYVLGLYSQGFEDFQKFKLSANDLLHFFDPKHHYILKKKMDSAVIENLPENTVIIDDKPNIIAFLESFPNVIPLHIVRNTDNHVGEYTLSSLNDLFPILDSLRDA